MPESLANAARPRNAEVAALRRQGNGQFNQTSNELATMDTKRALRKEHSLIIECRREKRKYVLLFDTS
ncbi:hypothetical protein [Bacillus sp. 2205SS5-2]|uniref:hypothetical protein n=1 Tax=Bacillus sp. 2205SS5-2 TaxID=3109031 RepID=UPI003006CD13